MSRNTSSCRCVCKCSPPGLPAEPISRVLSELRVENFRCIESAQLRFDSKFNVFTGGNGAGKTSFLEAIYFLGRGRSFRTADSRVLIRSGASTAEISGNVATRAGETRLGIRIAPSGLEIHANGQTGGGSVELSNVLPIQALHADIGGIVQGPPDTRRRLLDWGVFHVEPQYLRTWRQFRRALLQRNSALRDRAPDALLDAWENELAVAGRAVDISRIAYVDALRAEFADVGRRVAGLDVGLRYQRGWPASEELVATLRSSREGDGSVGYTRAGPHRADLQFEIEAQQSRWRASKGQQKMLAASLILAQSALVARRLGDPVALVVDEPAADLDRNSLMRLMQAIERCPAQIFLAAITADALPLESSSAMFHVEHGGAKALL